MNERPSRARLTPALPLLLALGLVAVTACGAAGDSSATGVPSDAAKFRLESLDGRNLGPPDYPGQVVVVDFWATWCMPCRAQARILEGLHGEWAARGVQFLAVDVAEERETVEGFVQDNPFPYPVLLDPEDELSARLGLMALPTLMVIDRQGQVIYMEAGIADRGRLEKLFEKAGAEA